MVMAITKRTAGYLAILSEVKSGDIKHDPWGTNFGWMFALADVVYVETGDILPEYRPSVFLNSLADLEGYEQETLAEMLDSGEITTEDMVNAFTVLSRYDDWLRLAGKNY